MAPSLEEYVKAHGGTRVIRRILIANNGMAATKAIMSMRQWSFLELGSSRELEFIVMASKDDLEANAEFIRLADAFVEVPPGKNINNYANVPLIVQTAKQQGVHCVWPGWGHASENPALPLALQEAGIHFLGPTAPVMHALGDKIASTILAQSSKVPCIPWNGDGVMAEIQADGSIPEEPFKRACLKSYEEAVECAARIGYPVVLKASEGGGGKGIRKCNSNEELKVGWEQVTAEVVGSPVFMMQLCTGARHLEVQLVGDEHGSVVALIGRDCSTQRRFQKIFEEGPPTIADKDDFREAEKAAQRLAISVGYRGAGTVEYLYKPATKEFFFLELNPRLQVEHPVTEGITGVNVPALQLQIGMGIPLERVPDIRRFYGLDATVASKIDFLNDKYVYPNKHVIAARITAENPDDGFRPTSGEGTVSMGSASRSPNPAPTSAGKPIVAVPRRPCKGETVAPDLKGATCRAAPSSARCMLEGIEAVVAGPRQTVDGGRRVPNEVGAMRSRSSRALSKSVALARASVPGASRAGRRAETS